ncbi:LPS export ABC transporter ATP-binding protein [Oceanipulchritudo coccoides]|uniref:LPS export ABC transporter ATP-binding protein n=1 Tax=Oceanipulchritudo coccoides TaxID=2706888 RepID=UPI0031B89151
MPKPEAHSIETRGLVKRYGKREVVRGVDLKVFGGEIVGLLGPNGAGKTTSFYIIVGLVPASSGDVSINGKVVTRLPMFRRARMGIGYLPQEPSVFRRLSVYDNLDCIAQSLPMKKVARKERVEQLLHELGLETVVRQKAYTLSGGERRRLEIARALLTEPRFLLMDEPFSGVDPISVSEVQKIVLGLKDKGIGVLITDHNVRETLRIVDRAYLLHDGQVLAEGNSESLINDPDSRRFYLGEDFAL